jgi:hypothetical protein
VPKQEAELFRYSRQASTPFLIFFVARLRLPSPYTSVESGSASPFGHPNENAAETAALWEALDGSLPIDQL